MQTWMIYGANGYTGQLTAERAHARGLKPILAGRNAKVIESMGSLMNLPTRVFDLENAGEVSANLEGVAAVLNCAGPFSSTARHMLDGCVQSKTHYLDITGEIKVFEYVHGNGEKWRRAGIVAMPGVGFDVVPSDCLAAMLKRELPSANHLKLAFKSRHGKLSPGTTKTMIEGLPDGGKIRRDGKIVSVSTTYKVEMIPFEFDPESAITIPWGDVSTAYYSTGIPNIEVFMGADPKRIKQMNLPWVARKAMGLAPVQWLVKRQVAKKVKGPTEEQRRKDEMLLYGEVTDSAGQKVAMRMRTPEGYDLTATSSLAAMDRLLNTELAPGAYTPSMAFGADFVLGLEGVRCSKVE